MNEEVSSEVADAQLDVLERDDPNAYADVMILCGLMFDHPGRAQSMSSAISTDRGTVLRLTVPGRYRLRILWTSTVAGEGPRIEAVIEHR